VRRLLLVALAFALTAAPAAASERHPTLAELEPQLICPVCQTTLDQSDSPAANEIRAYVREQIAAGRSESQIKAALVQSYGPGVLAAPTKHGFDLLAWLLPLAGLAAALVVVSVLAWRWSRRRAVGPSAADAPDASALRLEPGLERRLDDELARFDA
jgi:cytochrome c-type biogenesis protein CcmH